MKAVIFFYNEKLEFLRVCRKPWEFEINAWNKLSDDEGKSSPLKLLRAFSNKFKA